MRRAFSLLIVGMLVSGACWAQGAEPLSAWVQLGDTPQVRAVVSGEACPTLLRDGVPHAMMTRAAADADFPLLCALDVPTGTKSLTLNGNPLSVPVENPTRVMVLGDTGCRVQGSQLQACNDTRSWVFPALADEAAKLRPDLVIHVGDYVSREGPCPAGIAGCEGSPFGDNWPAWRADLFSPAAPLLSAAPVVFARGNHEDCNRQGRGWLRLMGQGAFDPMTECARHVAPFSVSLGSVTLAVLDTASAPESELVPDMVSAYAADLKSLSTFPSPVWLVQHRPILGAIAGPLGIPIGGNLTLSAAIRSVPVPATVDLMLSGHIHGFEAMNYYSGFPPQIISGNGGDLPHDIPRLLKGALFQGAFDVTVKDGVSASGFGFLLMTKSEDGWLIDTYGPDGALKMQCRFKDRRVECPNRQ